MSAFNPFLPVPSQKDQVSFPNFAKPFEISHYSSDTQNRLHWDKRQLSYYAPPESIETLKLDLNDGYEKFVDQRHRLPGCLDDFLRWILEERRRRSKSKDDDLSLKDLVHGANFVCWRGIFTKLAATPYEERESWLLAAVRFQDVIFLMQIETEQEKERCAKMTERDKRMTYWGHRFERYVTRSTPPAGKAEKPIDNCVVDCNAQYCVVFRTKITQSPEDTFSKQYRLLYGAEVDCMDDRDRYIELKTSRVIDGWRQERNFKRFKLLKWWLQSFLAGIDRIVCGYRDDAGIVKYLTTYDVDDMPRSVANAVGDQPLWSGALCMTFLLDLLSFIDKNTPAAERKDCVGEITVFEYLPVSRQVRIAANHGWTSDQVLPDWFVGVFGKV